jgi:hypothetical protein
LKAIYVPGSSPGIVEIHFSRELPVFPKQRGRHRQSTPRVMLSRSVDLDCVAERLTNINTGNFCVELEGRRQCFRRFLADLVFLDGIEMIIDAERFTLTVGLGRCFDAEIVCRSVVNCVHHHFYSSERLSFESELVSSEIAPGDGGASREHDRNTPAKK